MDEPTRRQQAILRLMRRRWRRFARANRGVAWAAIAVAGVGVWLGVEREFACPDFEVGDSYGAECTCERDGSRWRYGRCEPDPVEWTAADHIALAVLVRQDEEGGLPLLELEIRNILRGSLVKGDTVVFRGSDARRLLGEIVRHPHGSAREAFIVMFRAWGAGVERWQLLDGGYYPVRAAADGEPAMVFLKPRDIQIFNAETGGTYPQPPAKAPVGDFMFSLWLEWPAR